MMKVKNKWFVHNEKIPKPKKPTKKYMQLHGKTVYDKNMSNVGQTVWNKITKKTDGIIHIFYALSHCDKEGCNGTLKYDERGFKHCCKCGLGIRINPIENILRNFNYKNDEIEQIKSNSYKKDENIKGRNRSWDYLKIDEFIYDNDKGATELKNRIIRIKDFESRIGKGKSNTRGNKSN